MLDVTLLKGNTIRWKKIAGVRKIHKMSFPQTSITLSYKKRLNDSSEITIKRDFHL